MHFLLSPAERLIAFRYLRARREEGLISIIALFSLIGIALGVATLIVVLAVMRGVRGEMIESIIGLQGHVEVASITRSIEDYEGALTRIRAVPGVKSAIPVAEGQVMVSSHGQALGANASGVRPEDLKYKPLLTQKLVEGDIATFSRGEGVLIGKRMAERLGLRVGDSVTLISPQGRATPMGSIPRIKAYPVAGIFNIGMFAYDNGLVVMPFSQAQVFFTLSPTQAGLIEVNGADADNAQVLARSVASALDGGYRIYDWKATNGQIFRAVMVQRNVFFMILALIILVASFNIISSLIMLVREKQGDIAILRTFGAPRGSILRIFVACGASIGVAGTLLGTGLGLLIACNTKSIQHGIEHLTGQPLFADELYFLSSLPAKVDAGEVLMVIALSLGLSLLATLPPARRAAKLDPAEVLRYA